MKQGKSISELAQEIERQQDAKRDLVSDTRNLRMENVDGEPMLNIGDVARTSVSQHAHGQIASRVKVPMQYYRRMQQEAPELLVENVNHWFSNKPERRMIRTLDNNTRAFLSDRYRPLDNHDLMEAILPVLIEEPNMKIESCDVTDSRLYIKALFPRRQLDVAVGDTVQSGIVISNDEVGRHSLRVEPLLFRLICLNGMIGHTAMRKYHVGRGYDSVGEGAFEIFRDETREQDDKAFWMKTQDTVRSALDDAAFRRLVSSMQESLNVKIEADPVMVVENTAKRFGLNDQERGGVLRHLIDGGDLSKYGLLNAVTRTSQDVDDYHRATELERLGGVVLELPKTDWQRLNMAA